MAEFSTSIDIDAPPEIVYDHLVTPAGLLAWMGQHAELRAVPGGDFHVDIDGAAIRGRYLELERPCRVVVSWGMADSDEFPPGVSRVEFTLTAHNGGTRLDLNHVELPDTVQPGYARGWVRFLGRLQTVAVQADTAGVSRATSTRDRQHQLREP